MTEYLVGMLAVVAALSASGVASPYLQLSDLVMINLVAVVAIAMRCGIGPSLATAALAAVSFDFFFIPPRFAFAPADLKGAITVVVMAIVARGAPRRLAAAEKPGRRTRRTGALGIFLRKSFDGVWSGLPAASTFRTSLRTQEAIGMRSSVPSNRRHRHWLAALALFVVSVPL